MFWSKEKKETCEIDWNHLNSVEQLNHIKEESKNQPILIYKHSTRCGISGMAMDRIQRSWTKELESIKTYYLDLISYRDISNAVAEMFGVYHESPQVILIRNGEAVYNASHMGISTSEIEKHSI